MSKVHMCSQVGCHTIVPFKQTYCDVHAPLHKVSKETYKIYNKIQRDKQADAFYHSTQWTQLRHYVFNRDYATCAVCGRTSNTLIADHIVRRDVCDDPLDANNIWLLCRGDHTIKTKIEERMLKSPNGKNKLKHISKTNWMKYINERKRTKLIEN